MIEVRRLVPDDWALWRQVRLAALADAPYAYGSTLARERAFDETTWRSRLSRDTGVAAVALAGDRGVGAIGGHTPPGADAVSLVALWADPASRGQGVGDALVTDLVAWARETGWSQLRLQVVRTNTPARALFLRHGFAPTGALEPLPSDPSVTTEFMARTV